MNKSQKYLNALQKSDPMNRKCVDCSRIVGFVDLKFGSFICTRCAGLHRELGTDYCVVRSISLDNIQQEHLKIFEQTSGNRGVNEEYEANTDRKLTFIKPHADSSDVVAREFIRHKYKLRTFYKQKEKKESTESKPTEQKKFLPQITQKLIVEDLIQFDQLESNNNSVQIENEHLKEMPKTLTPEQQQELEYKNKVNNIMGLFH